MIFNGVRSRLVGVYRVYGVYRGARDRKFPSPYLPVNIEKYEFSRAGDSAGFAGRVHLVHPVHPAGRDATFLSKLANTLEIAKINFSELVNVRSRYQIMEVYCV